MDAWPGQAAAKLSNASLSASLKGLSRLALKPENGKLFFFLRSLSLSQLFFFPSCSYVFFFLLLLFFYVGFIRAKFVLQFNDFALENCCAPMQATARGGGIVK